MLSDRLISLGSRGVAVQDWQDNLKIKPVDGVFGKQTDLATRKFQTEQGLEPDGIVGPKTREAMNNYLKAAIGLGIVGGIAALTSSTDDPEGLVKSWPLIRRLHPTIQKQAEKMIRDAYAAGIPIVITQGLRTLEDQQRLYDQGRVTPGAIVTNAPPGSSWHNFGLAFDVAILKNGIATWPEDSNLWNRLGDIGKKNELAWGGDFTTILDRPHFERHPMISLADARAGRMPVV